MRFMTLKKLWFWSRNALHNFKNRLRRKLRSATPTKPNTGRSHHVFNISQDSHPRKVTRWLSRGGGVLLSTSDLARAAQRHLHPRSRYAS